MNVDTEVDRYLALLRAKIRERGYTQRDVQEHLGWGQSYLSQLLTKQKALRLEQILSILDVIGVDPRVFFLELYRQPQSAWLSTPKPPPDTFATAYQRMTALTHGLRDLLLAKGLVTRTGLSDAVRAAKQEA